MCLRNHTKDGIGWLPKEGVYYKTMKQTDTGGLESVYCKSHGWIKGMNRLNPVWQYGTDFKAGAHFFRRRDDARKYMYPDECIVKFRIKRSDVEWIGVTKFFHYDEEIPTAESAMTVTSCRARLIGVVSVVS